MSLVFSWLFPLLFELAGTRTTIGEQISAVWNTMDGSQWDTKKASLAPRNIPKGKGQVRATN